MKSEQKIVAIGAASGVILMSATIWILTTALPAPAIGDMTEERLAYALKANVFAAVPFFIMLATALLPVTRVNAALYFRRLMNGLTNA